MGPGESPGRRRFSNANKAKKERLNLTNGRHHGYSDFSGLYDDGYDDFVERNAKKMAKSKKGTKKSLSALRDELSTECPHCHHKTVRFGSCHFCGKKFARKNTKTVPSGPSEDNPTE